MQVLKLDCPSTLGSGPRGGLERQFGSSNMGCLWELGIWSQGIFLCTLRVCTIGLGSLNHGIWPLMSFLGPTA